MDWLQTANDAFAASDSYVEANYRSRWDRSLNLFNSEHPSGSKYHSEAYRYRSKIFRPKTRSVVRKNEAAAAAAYFSNQDVVAVEPENPRDPASVASAAIMKALLQYRLTKTIPWFQTVIGAIQTGQVMSAVCSRQEWDMVSDKPTVTILPLENLRFAPEADWVDPVESSPYIIELLPMYMMDVRERMNRENGWKKVPEDDLKRATEPWNSTGDARRSPDQNPYDEKRPLGDYETVWVRRVIMRQPDGDVVFYTAGDIALLSDPVPLEEVFFHGRPYVWGVTVIEAHHVLPKGPVEMGDQLQVEANEIVNQRLDNVKLVLNKRWIAKRGAQVDLESLVRNVAGSVTLANNPEDVKEVNWPDITASAYAEQDRVNVDFDELLGNFSSGSVLTNRKMNETVGGMNMIASGANQLTEYLLRTFTETWTEKVLRQLVKLEQKYETDIVVLSLAAEQAQLFQRFGISQITDELLNRELTVTVNVGMGSTDPQQKVQKLMMGVQAVSVAMQNPGLNGEELAKEIFGYLGWRDGGRFVQGQQNPMLMQAQKAIQQMQQELQQAKIQLMVKNNDQDAEVRARVVREMHRLDGIEKQLKVTQISLQAEADRIKQERKLLEMEKQFSAAQLNTAEQVAMLEIKAKQKDIQTAETVANLKVSSEIERGAADVAAREREAQRGLELERIRLGAEQQAKELEAERKKMAEEPEEPEAEDSEEPEKEDSSAAVVAALLAAMESMQSKLEQAIESQRTVAVEPLRDESGKLIGGMVKKADGTKQQVTIQ